MEELHPQSAIRGYGWYIKRIDNALAKEMSRNMRAHQLTMQQNHVLVLLAGAPQGTLTLKELEEQFGCAQSTVAGLAARLEKKGLIQGFIDESDRRVKHVRLTESGRAMNRNCYEDVVASERRMTALLSEEEQISLLTCLQKVYEAIK